MGRRKTSSRINRPAYGRSSLKSEIGGLQDAGIWHDLTRCGAQRRTTLFAIRCSSLWFNEFERFPACHSRSVASVPNAPAHAAHMVNRSCIIQTTVMLKSTSRKHSGAAHSGRDAFHSRQNPREFVAWRQQYFTRRSRPLTSPMGMPSRNSRASIIRPQPSRRRRSWIRNRSSTSRAAARTACAVNPSYLRSVARLPLGITRATQIAICSVNSRCASKSSCN